MTPLPRYCAAPTENETQVFHTQIPCHATYIAVFGVAFYITCPTCSAEWVCDFPTESHGKYPLWRLTHY